MENRVRSLSYASTTYKPTPTCELEWKHLVHNEIIIVTSAMRKNARWAGVSVGSLGDLGLTMGLRKTDSHEQRTPDSARDSYTPLLSTSTSSGSLGNNNSPTLNQSPAVPRGSSIAHRNVYGSANALISSDGRYRNRQSPLMQSFSNLRTILASVENVCDMDALVLLTPFLDVIHSGDTSGPITGAALSSVEKFLTYGIVGPDSINLPTAMSALAAASTHCKFEATDSDSDDVVLLKILHVLRIALTSECGAVLADQSVCMMIETALSMCCQGRLSEMLRRSAEHTLTVMVQTLFGRLQYIDSSSSFKPTSGSTCGDDHYRLRSDHGDSSPTYREKNSETGTFNGELVNDNAAPMKRSFDMGLERKNTFPPPENQQKPVLRSPRNLSPNISPRTLEVNTAQEIWIPQNSTAPEVIRDRIPSTTPQPIIDYAPDVPYGLPSIRELLRVLISFTNPHNHNHTESVRLMSLNILNVALEVGGKSLGRDCLWCEDDEGEGEREVPSEGNVKQAKKVGEKRLLRDMIMDDLCKNLFQLARTESIPLLTLTLRVTTTIFHTLRPYLKLQQELFLLFLLERADPPAWKQKRLEIMPELDVRQSRYFEKESQDTGVDDAVNEIESTKREENEKKTPTSYNGDTESTPTLDTVTASPANSNPVSGTPGSQHQSPKTHLRRSHSNPVGNDRPPSSRGLRSAYANENSVHRPARTIPPGPAPATGEVRELLLECLGQFVRVPSFMVDLWLNYDCDVGCENMFEEVIGFLCRNCFPNSTAYATATAHILCLDSLLLFLRYVVERGIKAEITNETIEPKKNPEPQLTITMNDSTQIRSNRKSSNEIDGDHAEEESSSNEQLPTAQHLMEARIRKEILLEGAKRFNKKPKDGIAFLQERGMLPPHPIPEKNMAQFLLSTPKLDKKLMGEYLCKPSNVPLLRAFLDLFDFKGKRIDEALRLMLESFRLPGESQQIERIMEQFSDVYFNSGPVDIRNRDDTFLLSYSIIMLNTDLHNPQVRQRMSIEDYMKNLRGFEFTKEYLTSIYDAILKREIVMPEEHEGQLGFNYAWKELLKRSEKAGTLKTANTGMYDKDMFDGVWHTIISALYYAFHRAQDDVTLQKAIACFNYCAQIASHHGLPEVTDHLIFSLSKITGLHEASDGFSRPTNDRTVDLRGGEGKITVSALSNRLGNSYKGQVATVVMFGIASENGNMLQESWKTILEIVRNLFRHSMLPMSMFQVEDFLCGTIPIPRAPKLAPPKPERNDGSLLSALSSYLLSPYSSYDASRAEPTEEEVEFAKSAMECIGACKLEEVFADIRFLEEEALQHLMRAILYVSSATTDNTPAPTNGRTRPYDASLVFFLELMVNITIQNRDRIQFLWPIVFEHLSGILAQASSLSILLTERAVVGLLRLCIRLAHKEEMIDEVFKSLDLLLALPPDVLNSTAEQMMAGILNLVKSDTEHIRGRSQWETIFSLLSTTSTHPEASKYSFQAVSILVAADSGAHVTEDNFGEVVDILISFAAAGAGVNPPDNQDKSRASPRNVRVMKNSNASVDRAMKAVEQLYGLHTRADMLIKATGMKSDSAWSTYWLPILSGLSQQCYHPCRDVRQHALTYLQRALLLPDLLTDDVEDWGMAFYHVLFPLLEELLKPEVFLLDPQGMDETRMRVSGLLCKIFLHHLNRLLGWPGLVDLWIRILRFMDLYMHAGENDYLFEGVPESLKNMLLVMSTSGVFFTGTEPSQQPGGDEKSSRLIQQRELLWDTTWKQVSKFLPNLKEDLFPTEDRPLKSTVPEPSASPLDEKSETKGDEIKNAEGGELEVKPEADSGNIS